MQYASCFNAFRLELWRRRIRPGSMPRKLKLRQGERCTSFPIHWNLMNLLICGRNDVYMMLSVPVKQQAEYS